MSFGVKGDVCIRQEIADFGYIKKTPIIFDRELEEASSDLITAIENLGEEFRLYRSTHRKLHLDEIEKVLRRKDTS